MLLLLAYLPALGSSFIADDYADIAYLSRADFLDLLTDGAWGVDGGGGRYRPVLHLFAKLEWLVFGTSPLGYHLTSLLLHACCAILTVFVLKRALESIRGRDPRRIHFVAWTAGFLWLLHPVHPGAVSWFAAVGGQLGLLFTLLALACYLELRTGRLTAPSQYVAGYLAAWLAALLAHLSHETVLFLALLPALVEVFVVDRQRHLSRRYKAAMLSLVFFASALVPCLVLRSLFIREPMGGDILGVLGQIAHSWYPELLLGSLAERAGLLLGPAHQAVFAWPFAWSLLLVSLLVLAPLARPSNFGKARNATVFFVLVAAVFYLPSFAVQIRWDNHQNSRQLYGLALPYSIVLALALSTWRRGLRSLLLVLLGCAYTVVCSGVNRVWHRSAVETQRWAMAAARVSEQLGERESAVALLDPPLERHGLLLLENAYGYFLKAPFHGSGRECFVLSSVMVKNLAILPEGRPFLENPVQVLRLDEDGSFHDAAIRHGPLVGPWSGPRVSGIELPSFSVQAIEADAEPGSVLEWVAEDGTRGRVAGVAWGNGAVIFPVGSCVAWLLAGRVIELRITGPGDVGAVRALARLPELPVAAPPDELLLHPGGEPPLFVGRRLAGGIGAGSSPRITFRTWKDSKSIPLPIPLESGSLEYRPGDAGPPPLWSDFQNLLFVLRPKRLYWCFEEVVDRPGGDAVVLARSRLRQLIPVF